MRQVKRFGGDNRIGQYTEWLKNDINYCIYCGEIADTREHVPSKVFLLEPFPNNLSTIPSCAKCNNDFSENEVYVSSHINVLRSLIEKVCIDNKFKKILEHDNKLKRLLENQIREDSNEIYFSFDIEKFKNIIEKLALGHLAYEFDCIELDCQPEVYFDWTFNLDERQINNFKMIPAMDIAPEIGSRSSGKLIINFDSDSEEYIPSLDWQEVQRNRYEYIVYFDDKDSPCVKIIISNIVFCIVKF